MKLRELKRSLEGDLFTDQSHRIAYATDASPYKETPLGVALPKTPEDLKKIIRYCEKRGIAVIPRGAGTSLAGQVVGAGLVVDVSRHFRKIVEFNPEEQWVIVEPGVILNELNQHVKPYNLFFAPETSTASRCTIGGMVGNNSCGLHSVVYGSTRDHTLALDAILSDGSEVHFGPLDTSALQEKREESTLEGEIYRCFHHVLSDKENQTEIAREFPEKTLPRKNTGYALDELLDCQPFKDGGPPFNLAKFLTGSEGTLAFTTRIKLNLTPLPPSRKAVMCAHFKTLEDALAANLIALKHSPEAVELMDNQVLKLTEGNILQQQNRFFVKGDPGAILIIEFIRESDDSIKAVAQKIEADMKTAGFGYHYPVISDPEKINQVWDLRRSALGVLSNMPGDAKPVSVIEDTAVHPSVLPAYIADFKETLAGYGLSCVYHAHIGSGELHSRPILNLKNKRDVITFKALARDIAHLVKKYNGSLSGEHGDGRLRGEFIPIIIGEKNYQLLREIKSVWDPKNIFNPGKIIDSPPMDGNLRYTPGEETKELATHFDFTDAMGVVRAMERCNGSGDCRNTINTGKVMCPSYQATNDELLSTRARANLLRELVSGSSQGNPFDYKALFDVLDLCLSCKSCKSECPSGVDMAKLKAEFLQWYYESNHPGPRAWFIANMNQFYGLGSLLPTISNFFLGNRVTASVTKSLLGFTRKRSLPRLHRYTLKKWVEKHLDQLNQSVGEPVGEVLIFNDELSNYLDVETAISAIRLLNALNYTVHVSEPLESGRVYISKGFIKKAKVVIQKNVDTLRHLVSPDCPLIGFDPSTVLSIRDEYIELCQGERQAVARRLSESTFLIEEFLAREMDRKTIRMTSFTSESNHIIFHGHCHQKVLSTTSATQKMLSFPENYTAEEIEAGCCGMAGSFGYEKEHYDLSVKIGEMRLFPAVRKAEQTTAIAAPGLSCRQQIKDNTGKVVRHPVSILFEALKS